MADYGNRADGTKKGRGYYGEIKMNDGSVMTEMGVNETVDGKDVHYPLVYPGMPRADIDHLTSGKRPTGSMFDGALDHAMRRIKDGKSPFAGDDDPVLPLPASEKEEYSNAWKEMQ